MSLHPGARIGAYEIVSLLGAGGMGEVFRARDTKLNRDVAIKVLLAEVAGDPERLARFHREAQLLASLNHPHIAAIYGVEDAGPTVALVMELVGGSTLADRLASGPIPVDEALPIARQIAEALEVAHDQGIVHRDLKPANVKVRDDGTVKVLDFGLAKALDSAAGSRANATMSPTLSMHATQAGLILGTAAYMAPEQARGRPVDRRADIWAFGVIVFEMLAGRRAFEGDDISITLAAVLKDDVDWSALPADTPPHLRTLLRRCLQKDPQRRLPHIGLARIEIEEGQSGVLASSAGVAQDARPALPTPPRPLWKRAAPTALAVVAAAALSAGAVWTSRPAALRLPIVRFHTALPGVAAAFDTSTRQAIAISPDGSAIAFAAVEDFSLHRLADDQTTQLVRGNKDECCINPVFSPDGRWIGFFTGIGGGSSNGTLKKIAVSGGAPVTLCPSDPPFGASWSDGAILFSTSKGILRVAEYGGTAETLVPAGRPIDAKPSAVERRCAAVRRAASSASNAWNRAQIVVQSLKTGQRRTLVDGGTDPRYVPTGHLVYARGGVLFAVPVQPSTSRSDRRSRSGRRGRPPRERRRRGALWVFGHRVVGVRAWTGGQRATDPDLAWTEKDGGRTYLKVPPSQDRDAAHFARWTARGRRQHRQQWPEYLDCRSVRREPDDAADLRREEHSP